MANTLYDFYTGQGQNLPSIAERAKDFEKAGIGSASDYTGTAEQNTSLLKSLQTPKVPDEIDASNLGNQEVDIPPQPNPEDVMQGASQTVQNIAGETIDTAQTDLDKQIAAIEAAGQKDLTEREGLTSEYEKLLNKTVNKQADFQTALEEQGVPEMNKELQGIVNQMRAEQASLNLGVTNEQGRPTIAAFSTGKIAQMKNMSSAKLGALAVQAQAVQGNIELARSTAESLINAQYAPIEQQIANQKEILALNYDNLSLRDQRRADELNRLYTERENQIADEKTERQNIQNIMITAAENGASQEQLEKIRNSESLEDAIMNAGSTLSPIEDNNGNWATFEDADGNTMLYDKNTGNTKPVTLNADGSVQYDTFTDANGISWNMTGWAVDPTKAAQMQQISDQIGKVTDENIDEKVRQFTPGLTADMIREASASSGVSWEAIMTMAAQESNGGTSNVAKKNNNYAGLTWSEGTQWKQPPYNGEKGTARPEGGNYTKFPTPQQGLNAMAALMAQKGTIISEEDRPDPEIQGYIKQINEGSLTVNQALNEIDENKKAKLIEKLSTTPKETDDSSVLDAKDKISKIESLKKSSALNDAVGPNWFARDWSKFDMSKFTGNYQEFIGNISLLTDQLTLDKLIESKNQGATFGALSEKELGMLANAATQINNWAKEKDGKIIGYDISEDAFKSALDEIKTYYNRAIERKTNTSYKTMEDGTIWQDNGDGTYSQIK